MRLIDADYLITDDMDDYDEISVQWVRKQPTIEAIPIEWIKDYANELILLEESNYFAYRGLGDYGKGLLELIDKWGEQKQMEATDETD